MADVHSKFGASNPMMTAVGLSWSGVEAFGRKSVKLLQEHGYEFIDLISSGMRAIAAISERDFAKVLFELNQASVNLSRLIAAIKEEFFLE